MTSRCKTDWLDSIFRVVNHTGRTTRRRQTTRPQFRCERLEPRRLLAADFVFAAHIVGNGPQYSTDIASDSSGNIYTVGHFRSSVDFDPGVGTFEVTSNSLSSDVFVSKLDSAGNFVWAKVIGGMRDDEGGGIAIDRFGNVYVTGTFTGPCDFDPGTGFFNLTSAAHTPDVFVCKLDSAGQFVWAKAMGGRSDETSGGVAVDSFGNVYTTGTFEGQADFDPGFRTFNLNIDGGHSAFVSKLNSSGHFVWAKGIGGAHSRGIDLDEAGNVYTTGYFSETVDFDPDVGVFERTSAGSLDVFALKLNNRGDFDWAASIGGPSFDFAIGLAVDPSGHVHIAGGFEVQADLDPGPQARIHSSNGNGDVFVVELDDTGELVWSNSFGGISSDFGHDVAIDRQGAVYITGGFGGEVDFDPGTGVFQLTSAAVVNGFVAKFDTAGEFVWAGSLGGSRGTFPQGIALDINSNILTTGGFNGPGDFDPGPGTFNLPGPSTYTAVYISKLTQELSIVNFGPGSGDLVLRRNGHNLEVFDVVKNSVVSVRSLSELLGVQVTGAPNASDRLTVDYRFGGPFSFPQGIRFDGGVGAGDELRLIGIENEAIIYAPSAALARSGRFSGNGSTISFTNLESTAVTGLQSLTIEPQGSVDQLNAATTIGFSGSTATKLTGSSGGTMIVPVTFDKTSSVTIDTASREGLPVAGNDSITLGARSLKAAGLRTLLVRTGEGDDLLTIEDRDIGLQLPGGEFWFLGGLGIDRLITRGDADWQLSTHRLASSGGGQIRHEEVEKATITGGNSANDITARGFNGDATLDGAGGNDLLRGGSGNDFLTGGLGDDRIYGNSGDDTLYGQDGHDRMLGGSGHDTLRGGAGNDHLAGGSGNDYLYGDAGHDHLFGDSGNDQLNGGAGDDVLTGGAGLDLYLLQGTSSSDSLELRRMTARKGLFTIRDRFHLSVIEHDRIEMDAADQFRLLALGGDDLIAVDRLFRQFGSVDGGTGADTCTAPATWSVVDC